MSTVDISVVVPVYNVERYLDRCIKSIVNQIYNSFEILLIDDGSTDHSGIICDEWLAKDNRIKVVHKTNGGLSSARNEGIREASGKYICFIDSDDWVDKEYLKVLRDAIISSKADFVQCDYKKVSDTSIIFDKSNNSQAITLFDSKEAIASALLNKKITWSAWGKLYSLECFESIRYPEGKIFEDKPVTTQIILHSKKVAHIERSLYNYYFNENSISNNSFNIQKLDAIEMSEKIATEIQAVYPDLKPLCFSQMFFSYLYIFMDTYEIDKFNFICDDMYSKMKKYWMYVVFNREVPIVGKIKALMLFVGKKNYYLLLKKIQK